MARKKAPEEEETTETMEATEKVKVNEVHFPAQKGSERFFLIATFFHVIMAFKAANSITF